MNEKGRAETLPFKMFIKFENLFNVSPNQRQHSINHTETFLLTYNRPGLYSGSKD